MPAFGDRDAWLAIVGLAPGKHGANRTGRPFTGDYAGDLLYATLLKFGLADGRYRADPGDGLRLNGAIILNAVKCLPPANKPEPSEIRDLPQLFRGGARRAAERPGAGRASARSRTSPPARALGHAARRARSSAISPKHVAPDGRILLSSYHCSRYNQNTGRLTRRCSKACSSGRWSCAMSMTSYRSRNELACGGRLPDDAAAMHQVIGNPTAMRVWSNSAHAMLADARSDGVAVDDHDASGG